MKYFITLSFLPFFYIYSIWTVSSSARCTV